MFAREAGHGKEPAGARTQCRSTGADEFVGKQHFPDNLFQDQFLLFQAHPAVLHIGLYQVPSVFVVEQVQPDVIEAARPRPLFGKPYRRRRDIVKIHDTALVQIRPEVAGRLNPPVGDNNLVINEHHPQIPFMSKEFLYIGNAADAQIPLEFIQVGDKEDPPAAGGCPGYLGNERKWELMHDYFRLGMVIKSGSWVGDAKHGKKGGLLDFIIRIEICFKTGEYVFADGGEKLGIIKGRVEDNRCSSDERLLFCGVIRKIRLDAKRYAIYDVFFSIFPQLTPYPVDPGSGKQWEVFMNRLFRPGIF